MKTYNVAVLGATGIIGQQFCRILTTHPTFNLQYLFASDKSEGKLMKEIWHLPFFECPTSLKDRKVEDITHFDEDVDIVFSALPKSVATEVEAKCREMGVAVFSNAGSHRMDPDVPILIPEINGDHISLVKRQQEKYGTDGFIITNSNCSAAGASIYLTELDRLSEIETAVVTTYQALSGAGIGGVSALDIAGNVIPYIGGEEPKIKAEIKKIAGKLTDGGIEEHPMKIVANAARVNVSDGHLEAITGFFRKEPVNEILDELKQISSPLDLSRHHIAPISHLNFVDDIDGPQPRRDVFKSDRPESAGMTVHMGRIRSTPTNISSYVLVHNTIRGGAGGSVLNAEYAVSKGYV